MNTTYVLREGAPISSGALSTPLLALVGAGAAVTASRRRSRPPSLSAFRLARMLRCPRWWRSA